jgi:hypothetical protein
MDTFHQDAAQRQEHAVHIGVLQEQVRSIMASLADQKEVNKAQSKQLTEILDKLSEARGGWRTLMWLGGAAASLGGLATWAAQHLVVK